MKKTRIAVKIITGVAALFPILSMFPVRTPAATENDLREVMGLVRLNTDEYREQAAAILAQGTSYEEFRRLAQEMDEARIKKSELLADRILDRDAAYEEMKALFVSGGHADEVLQALIEYDRQCIYAEKAEADLLDNTEKIRMDDMEEAVKQAGEIMNLCTTTEDIGEVGDSADTFLLRGLHLMDVSPEALSCQVSKGESVYSQFNGIVQEITADTVCIGSGETIFTAYKGVRADKSLKVGERVSQYQKVGECLGSLVTVAMSTCAEEENILKMYGSRAKYWYSTYLDGLPWADACVKLDGIRGFYETEGDKNTGSVMVTADGETVPVETADAPHAGRDLILDKNPFIEGLQ